MLVYDSGGKGSTYLIKECALLTETKNACAPVRGALRLLTW